jgi:hypothetical protein
MEHRTELPSNSPHIDDGKYIALVSILSDIQTAVDANGLAIAQVQEHLGAEIVPGYPLPTTTPSHRCG